MSQGGKLFQSIHAVSSDFIHIQSDSRRNNPFADTIQNYIGIIKTNYIHISNLVIVNQSLVNALCHNLVHAHQHIWQVLLAYKNIPDKFLCIKARAAVNVVF